MNATLKQTRWVCFLFLRAVPVVLRHRRRLCVRTGSPVSEIGAQTLENKGWKNNVYTKILLEKSEVFGYSVFGVFCLFLVFLNTGPATRKTAKKPYFNNKEEI